MTEEEKSLPSRFKLALILGGTAFLLIILWCLPLASFHHMALVGLFAWLFINGEDPDHDSWLYFHGEEYIIQPCGLALTIGATLCLLVWAWRAGQLRRLLGKRSC